MTITGLAMDLVGQLNDALKGRYRIERELGSGGMATVYAATDLRHNRTVAVKVLRDGLPTAGTSRFQREIDLIAHLRHPHIVPLFDSGDAGGVLFYVMPLVEGESLRARLQRGERFSVADTVRLISEVGEALDYAHTRGIIHRDVKPENILVESGHAAVADFGIALASSTTEHDRLTSTGIVVGTPGYMSPEQVSRDRELDARSDQYALACVAFEMLTGRPPFVHDGKRPVHVQHLLDPAPSIRALLSSLPKSIDAALQRALSKDPGQRFPSAAAFVGALGATPFVAAPTRPLVSQSKASPLRRWRTGSLAIVAVVGVATLTWAAYVTGLFGRGSGPSGMKVSVVTPRSLAVLPFANVGGVADDEYLSAGITEELIGTLNRLGRLRVASRTSSFAFRNKGLSLQAIADSLHVNTVLEGSVQSSGGRLRIRARLVQAATDSTLWSGAFDREHEDVIKLEGDLAQAIATQLLSTLLPSDRAALSTNVAINPDAHDQYLKGRFYWNQRTPAALLQAVTFFQRALAIDSNYALAYSGLADTYSLLPWSAVMPPREATPLARAAAEHALRIDNTLADAHVSLGIVHLFSEWRPDSADREFTRALALDPNNANVHLFRTWVFVVRGQLDSANMSLERARSLEPLSLIINARIAQILAYQKRFVESESAARQALQIDSTFAVARGQLARALVMQGKTEEAVRTLPPFGTQLGSQDAGIRGMVFVRAGQRDRARAELQSLRARPYVASDAVAAVYTALGDKNQAIAWLERSFAARDISLVFITAEPMFDPLRNDPRFRSILVRMGLR